MTEKVALIGSGNWGSAIATKLGKNALTNPLFDKVVEMWVFEEYIKKEGDDWTRPARGAKPPEGKTWVDEGYEPLTGVINTLHENPIYLKGIPLPTSIHAEPDVKKAVTGATMMIFVIPHNFLAPIVPKMEGAFAKGAVGISLIKGIEFENGEPVLISDLLQKEMAKAEGNPTVRTLAGARARVPHALPPATALQGWRRGGSRVLPLHCHCPDFEREAIAPVPHARRP